MNIFIKIIICIVSIEIIINSFSMIFYPEIEFAIRGVCINCKNDLAGIIVGYSSLLFGIILLFSLFRKKKSIEYSKCSKCKEVYFYTELKNGICPKCNVKTIDIEKYYNK